MTTFFRLIWIATICLTCHALTAQVRFEHEKRIKSSLAPLTARQTLDECNLEVHIRWYLEISELGKTYEAKFQIAHSRFSVEFDSTGQLLDVECVVPLDSMVTSARIGVQDTLENRFSKFRMEKVQAQYLISAPDLCRLLLQNGSLKLPDYYEVVVSGLEEGRLSQYEFLFDHLGKLHRSSEIVARPSENMER